LRDLLGKDGTRQWKRVLSNFTVSPKGISDMEVLIREARKLLSP